MTDYLTVVTTTDAHEAAEALAASAVGARLAACAQVVGPITSVYRWDGKVERAREWQVVLKTTAERYPGLEAHIKAEHTYDVPEIIAGPIVAGDPAYLAWVSEEVGGSTAAASGAVDRSDG
ncbi:divalent-cation tolerance protein CutA [Yinghuangia sp. ASG 101]|uniref:divalent-cation tolerance protein CutA n=1 Tax=Yinghuangia sp. ASG 101 TaxID=2896848 RepID=UPI001E535357|nr:divalent-cation tolerance protein CutA [Yinghuangia sp. ASG 101]UGQ09252.1 divalent-cation tolerance protein CutA [Yinghuangia sp. ASG 101]